MSQDNAIRILDAHRIMAIATVRPDGWPQTTIVGYANTGLTVYFLVFRSSQKLGNIKHDDRVALAVGDEPGDLSELTAVYAGAHAVEVTASAERKKAWNLLEQRHPNLADFEPPVASAAAVMRADCIYISVLDYSQGFGHSESITVEPDPRRTVSGG